MPSIEPMHIYIPTYHRTGPKQQSTLKCLPKKWARRTTLVCPKEDIPALKLLARKYGCKIMRQPKFIKTIAQKRAWLLQTTPHKKILMLDDDLLFCHREYDKKGKVVATPYTKRDIHVHKALRWLQKLLQKYAHAGLWPRQGNNRRPERGCYPNNRIMYALAWDVDTVRKICCGKRCKGQHHPNCRLGRIEHREDMDYTLQLLRNGYENRVILDHMLQHSYANKGGATEERTVEASNKDAKKLAELHPGLVRVVSREYTASIPRLEVVCQWRKAFEQSKKAPF
jgi:hypothetical protein